MTTNINYLQKIYINKIRNAVAILCFFSSSCCPLLCYIKYKFGAINKQKIVVHFFRSGKYKFQPPTQGPIKQSQSTLSIPSIKINKTREKRRNPKNAKQNILYCVCFQLHLMYVCVDFFPCLPIYVISNMQTPFICDQ